MAAKLEYVRTSGQPVESFTVTIDEASLGTETVVREEGSAVEGLGGEMSRNTDVIAEFVCS